MSGSGKLEGRKFEPLNVGKGPFRDLSLSAFTKTPEAVGISIFAIPGKIMAQKSRLITIGATLAVLWAIHNVDMLSPAKKFLNFDQ